MDSGASLRRSSRAAARDALTKIRAASSGPWPEPAAAALEPAQPRQRKRQKTVKHSEPEPVLPAAGAGEQAATSDSEVAMAAVGQQKHSGPAKPRSVPKKKQTAAAEAAAGPSREYEQELWGQGYANIAGVDEAGRGPLAGPVVAAACIIPPHVHVPGIDDSKKLNEAQREEVYSALTSHPEIRWAVQVIEAAKIDEINILQAALKAMEGAAAGLGQGAADFLLVDGNRLPKAFDPERSRTIIKGDSKCYVIAAASIVAKVTRDRLMDGYHEQFPHYNFGQHKGYGVPAHMEAIRQHGPCPIHRRTFAPVKHWFPAGGAAE